MSEFHMTTLKDASLRLKKPIKETAAIFVASNFEIIKWRWADNKIRDSVKTSDLDYIIKSTGSHDLEFYRFDYLAKFEYPSSVSSNKKTKVIKFHVYPMATYDLEFSRCNTWGKVASWLLHISEKSWFSGKLANDFITECIHVHGLQTSSTR